MMNFRQRMGWLSVALFLLISAMATYYVFEVPAFSLEHVQRGIPTSSPPSPTWTNLPSLPVWMWVSVFLLPYLQFFLFLFSCTRADPQAVGYCILPVCIFLFWNRRKPTNHRVASVIDT
ncbi:lysosomal enzyme trafficking factor [Betta splendens]|uniref:Lysosomal enzyme trafficking factor n=1 Tax=Betta splendens TaxID=158456 RepID=A0A6P7LR10_BETSP|nr:lysosomal enzyme trafficking factor [Betta splendens]